MNILVADDHVLFRESLGLALQSIFPVSAITSTNDWAGVVAYAQSNQYDLLLLDLFMSDSTPESWVLALTQIKSFQKQAPICIVSASTNQAYVREAFRAGASGFISKTHSLEQMSAALKQVCSGKIYLPEQTWGFKPEAEVAEAGIRITWRQREVLELAAAGYSNKVICTKLNLAESTVKRHLHNVYQILKAKNRTDAIRIARQHCLLNE